MNGLGATMMLAWGDNERTWGDNERTWGDSDVGLGRQ